LFKDDNAAFQLIIVRFNEYVYYTGTFTRRTGPQETTSDSVASEHKCITILYV